MFDDIPYQIKTKHLRFFCGNHNIYLAVGPFWFNVSDQASDGYGIVPMVWSAGYGSGGWSPQFNITFPYRGKGDE